MARPPSLLPIRFTALCKSGRHLRGAQGPSERRHRLPTNGHVSIVFAVMIPTLRLNQYRLTGSSSFIRLATVLKREYLMIVAASRLQLYQSTVSESRITSLATWRMKRLEEPSRHAHFQPSPAATSNVSGRHHAPPIIILTMTMVKTGRGD